MKIINPQIQETLMNSQHKKQAENMKAHYNQIALSSDKVKNH